MRVQDVDGCRPCDGGVEALLDGNRRMLERLEGGAEESSLGRVACRARCSSIPTAWLERSLVRGPVVIGAGAVLRDAYVGPYSLDR